MHTSSRILVSAVLVGIAGCTVDGLTRSNGESVSASQSAASVIKYITPGVGTFTDASGNVYSIDTSGNADENGSPIPGGGNTAAMEYYDGNVYGKDATTHQWYMWTQTTWNGPVTAPPPPTSPPATNYITPGSGTFTDSSGNVYSIDSSGNADENGQPIPGGGNTAAMEYYDGVVYGQDATSGQWYIWSNNNWSAPVSAPPSGASGVDAGSGEADAGNRHDAGSTQPPPPPSGTRDPARYPGADGRFWSLPLQTTANWITSGPEADALHQGTPNVRSVGLFCVNWVVGAAGDPDCTVTDGAQSFTIKVPAGTLAENAGDIGDDSLGGTDSTRPYLGWSCNGALIDGSAGNAVASGGSTITCSMGLLIFDTTGPVMEDAVTGNDAYQSSDNAIGNLPDYELAQAVADPSYVPPHTVAVTADPTMVNGSLAWPAVVSDIDLTGPIPEGSLVGIPYNVSKPNGLSRGGSLLWDMFQKYGGIIYNVGGSGALAMETYAQQDATQALADDMNNSFPSIVPYMGILASDGSPGSQTSASTAKGMIGGARADAFPAPPTLALTPSAVHPQWYATSLGFFYNSP